MIPERYVLFVFSSALLLPWIAAYLAFRGYRRALVWSSLFAIPFGLSELLFAGDYWSPPSLFDLARRFHLDIESFVFLFGAGGVAAIVFNVVTQKNIDVHGPGRRPRAMDGALLALPALVFPVGLFLFGAPIVVGVIAMMAGAVGRVVSRPDLFVKTAVGGSLFAFVYLGLFASLVWTHPGYIDRYWSHEDGWMVRASGIPVAEILFGVSFGGYWSGLYEQWKWALRRASA